jgi:hypothetical protein
MSSAGVLADRIGAEAENYLGIPVYELVSRGYRDALAGLAEFLLGNPSIEPDSQEFTNSLDAAFNRYAVPWDKCSKRQQCWRMRVVDLARRSREETQA